MFRSRDMFAFALLLAIAAHAPGQDKPARDAEGRLPDVANPPSMSGISRIKPIDPNFVLGPAPKSVPVRVGGTVLDLRGNPVKGAKVDLIGTTITHKPKLEMKSAIVATTLTRDNGFYSFRDAKIRTSDGSGAEEAQTPYVQFRVVVRAPGYGYGWHHSTSMYAVDPPHPRDIQGRMTLDTPAVLDVLLRPAAELKGRAVDEHGKPVVGVKIQGLDLDLLDEEGRETSVRDNLETDLFPDGFGAAVTDADGRFNLAGLPTESCVWLQFKPKHGNASRWLYASTSAKEKLEHPQPPPQKHNGRGKHEVYPADMTVVLPTTRRLAVRVVGDDDGKPVADVGVDVMGETLATGIAVYGTSDAEGNLALDLPAGKYRSLYADPSSTSSRFIRTSLRPLVIADGPAVQSLELRMKVGAEINIEAIDTTTGKGVPKIHFEIKAEDGPDWEPFRTSTFYYDKEETGEDGKMRAVLAPAPGKTYRIRVFGAGMVGNPAPPPLPPDGLPYQVKEQESDRFTMEPGKTVKIRFNLKPKVGAR